MKKYKKLDGQNNKVKRTLRKIKTRSMVEIFVRLIWVLTAKLKALK